MDSVHEGLGTLEILSADSTQKNFVELTRENICSRPFSHTHHVLNKRFSRLILTVGNTSFGLQALLLFRNL